MIKIDNEMEKEIVLTSEEIHAICEDIASKLDNRFERDNVVLPVFVGVLKGSLNFMMDLLRCVKADVLTDYIQVTSYNGTSSTGAVILKKDLSIDVKGKTVVIVEDVVDTGLTMKYLIAYLKDKYQPKEVIVVALFDKLYLRQISLHVDYTGKVLRENKFLVGYGLDYKEVKRNVPYIYVARKEDIEQIDNLLEENK